MYKTLSVLALVLLTACGTVSGPDGNTFIVDTAYAGYIGYCGLHTGSTGCTAANKKTARDAKATALQAIADYNSGKLTDAELSKAINDALKVWQDLQK